jgi:hypothetical protein
MIIPTCTFTPTPYYPYLFITLFQALPAGALDSARRAGVLAKQSGFFNSWNEHHVVLTDEALFWFENQPKPGVRKRF